MTGAMMKKVKAVIPVTCEYNFEGCEKEIHHGKIFYENIVPRKEAFKFPIGLYNPTTVKIACCNCAKIIKPQKPRAKKARL